MTVKAKSSTIQPHYDFFISGRWRNRDNVLSLTRKIREKGYRVYCFLETEHNAHRVNNDPEEDMRNFEKLEWREDPYVKKVFESDMAGEKNSDVFVMLLPLENLATLRLELHMDLGKNVS